MDLPKVVQGCLSNDRQSQRDLYEHCFPWLLSMCRRYTQDETTQLSIINDGMLKVFKHIDQYDVSRPLEQWVKTIVFRALADYFRKQKSLVRFLLMEEDIPISSARPLALDHLQYEDIFQLTEQLPPKSKTVFIRYAIDGWTHKEIADELDISVGTSKWHLSTARKQLQDMLQSEYKDYGYG